MTGLCIIMDFKDYACVTVLITRFFFIYPIAIAYFLYIYIYIETAGLHF